VDGVRARRGRHVPLEKRVLPRRANAAAAPVLPPARPFLKWAGGKAQLFEQLRPLLPGRFENYFEPFVGGGAVFFGVRPRVATLSDVNSELVETYGVVRDEPDALIAALKRHRYEKDYFYHVRDQKPAELSLVDRAARMIFLNKTAFNGLYRVNSRGQFNVPFGRHRQPQFCDEDNLNACSLALEQVRLENADFELVLSDARRGDFVYIDPPYVPVSDTAYFTAYIPGGFAWADQQRLAEVVTKLAARGVKVMLSNSDVTVLRELYRDFRIETVTATRRINSRVDGRGSLTEIVVLTY
jgi:DNA adenine methylase